MNERVGHHSRITLVNATSKRDITEFWRVPPGASNPTCEGCEYSRGCPSINVVRKPGIVDDGGATEFTAENRSDFSGLSYRWSVQNGLISTGQRTSTIRVRPTALPVKATVKVSGVPRGCATTFEETYYVPCQRYLNTNEVSFWSEYRTVSWTRERKQLATLFRRALPERPQMVAYIEKGFPRGTSARARNAAIRRIKNYVHSTLKIPSEKLFVRTKIGTTATRLYLVPTNAPVLEPAWKESCLQR